MVKGPEDKTYVTQEYGDGDFDYNPPYWRQIIDEHNFRKGKINHSSENKKDQIIKEKEIALKHPESGAVVKTSDDGSIDIFAGDQLGIRIDPNTNSINLFGDTINHFAKNVNFKTYPNGLSWNGSYFNPSLYQEDDLEKGLTIEASKEYNRDGEWRREDVSLSPMIKRTNKVQYSEGMLDILEELGLPVNNVD